MKTGLVFPSNRCELCPLRAGAVATTERALPTVHGPTLAAVARLIVQGPIVPGPIVPGKAGV